MELSNKTSKFNQNLKETKECNKKILNYSNQYYELMPFKNEINEFISPINTLNNLKKEIDKCKSYNYIENTLKMFLGSLNHINTINPIDYIYESLGIKIKALDLKEKISISKYLIEYIKETYNSTKYGITNIFEIEKSNNDAKLNP